MSSSTMVSRIALLATGNELIEGTILNTNAQYIAQQLHELHYDMGLHISVSDTESDIVEALQFLLQRHAIIIITGGLGPTSDDRTRFALAKILQRDLLFNPANWETIVARLHRFNVAVHSSNRQQALFPDGAKILNNPHGTAAGCQAKHHNKLIFMLPGPPHECLPMFNEHVLPALLPYQNKHHLQRFKWLLLGVIEADIAAQFDALVAPFQGITGYRICTPYLEVKLDINPDERLTALLETINAFFADGGLLVSQASASMLLIAHLNHYPGILYIQDQATGGLLEATLTTPVTRPHLEFRKPPPTTQSLLINIEGLDAYWKNTHDITNKATLNIRFQQSTMHYSIDLVVPLRGKPLSYAVEYLTKEILIYLTSH